MTAKAQASSKAEIEDTTLTRGVDPFQLDTTPRPIHIRQHNDGLNEAMSVQTVQLFPPEEDQTRREHAQEADVNYLLTRYGAGALVGNGNNGYYGVANFDDDLTTAFETIQRAKDAHAALPPEVRKLYPTWEALAREIARGDENPALGKELDEKVKAATEAADKLERGKRLREEAEFQKSLTTAGSSSPAVGGDSPSEARQK